MNVRIVIAGLMTISFAGTALADEYYIVRKPDTHKCTVVTTKPATKEVVTQIGPIAFATREKAEERIKTVKDCGE